MKLYLSKPRGFCAGVVRAIKVVEEAIKIWGSPIYVKHEIVHNRHVVSRLENMGAVFIEDIEQVPEGAKLIYSAHGVSPAVRKQAKARNLFEIDATCSLVTRVHSAALRYAKKGYQIVLIGHKNHVEVIGTAGEAPDVTTVVESVDDVENLTFKPSDKLFYTTQTTLSLDDVKAITDALQSKYPQIETLPSTSICYATTNRQQALKQLLKKIDLVLVVGDPTSSNSNRLVEVAANENISSYLINSPSDINLSWLEGKSAIGMTAGASTPEAVVQDCVDFLIENGITSTGEVEYTEENVYFELPKEILQHKMIHS